MGIDIIKITSTKCKYNGVDAIRVRFSQDGNIYEQTYNIGSQNYRNLVQKSRCSDLQELEGKEVEVSIIEKLNKQGKAWKYINIL
jgi:ABC-type phosphonate transport system ATPase subunit